MTTTERGPDRRRRRGAPWTDAEDDRLLRLVELPPRAIAERMQRSWHACRRRIAYLRANGAPPTGAGHGTGGAAAVVEPAAGRLTIRRREDPR